MQKYIWNDDFIILNNIDGSEQAGNKLFFTLNFHCWANEDKKVKKGVKTFPAGNYSQMGAIFQQMGPWYFRRLEKMYQIIV